MFMTYIKVQRLANKYYVTLTWSPPPTISIYKSRGATREVKVKEWQKNSTY